MIPTNNAVSTQVHQLTTANIVTMWLQQVFTSKSKSARTKEAYTKTIDGFRVIVEQSGLDLLSHRVVTDEQGNTIRDDIATLAAIAQGYAPHSPTGRTLANATIAQRLAILSSFYRFAVKRRYIDHNPIDLVERPQVQAYAQATAIIPNLSQIDRKSPCGKRDYALLSLLLSTGRRASEIANLTQSDITVSATELSITTKVKGGKIMHDKLAGSVAKALRDYLSVAYPKGIPEHAPIFLSFSKRNAGQRISIQTVADICQRYLGTSKIHTTRHTFAARMESLNAPLSVIQERLGHANAATTSRYLHSLSSGSNPYIDELVKAMGID